MSRPRRRGPPREELDPGDEMLLTIGPPPRVLPRADWPEERERLRRLWALHRTTVLRRAGTERPWAWAEFDLPAEARRAEPVQDALLARGDLTPEEAMLARSRHPEQGEA